MPQQHTVAQGETLVTIAHRYGFRTWEAIWEHEANAALRSKRDPMVLAPGDLVLVPDKRPRDLDLATGQKHTFRIKTLKAHVRLALCDPEDQPYAGRNFELQAGAAKVEGVTDEQGVLHADVPLGSDKAHLKLFVKPGEEPLEWELRLGHLDPVDTDAGVIERLRNLGFDVGEGKALGDEPVQKALRAFQREHSLGQTGQADPATRQALVSAHDAR